jgi:hypothetical protein
MSEWSNARLLAAEYQSSGWSGIGFARFASAGKNTPELWDNIEYCEREAAAGKQGTEDWEADMKRLRELLAADGIEPPKFAEDDVVRFADGNGKMLLWGDHVEIDYMFVKGYTAEGEVEVVSDPYTFTFPESALVKVGESLDTEYDTNPESPNYGNEVYKWLPELNEPEEEPED